MTTNVLKPPDGATARETEVLRLPNIQQLKKLHKLIRSISKADYAREFLPKLFSGIKYSAGY